MESRDNHIIISKEKPKYYDEANPRSIVVMIKTVKKGWRIRRSNESACKNLLVSGPLGLKPIIYSIIF
jgi:hypothetical protein